MTEDGASPVIASIIFRSLDYSFLFRVFQLGFRFLSCYFLGVVVTGIKYGTRHDRALIGYMYNSFEKGGNSAELMEILISYVCLGSARAIYYNHDYLVLQCHVG